MTPDIIVMTSMTADEARTLTDAIKSTVARLHDRLLEAHEREAWRALGYANWTDYVQHEFNYSKAHAFRLLTHARKVRQLQAAAGVESPRGDSDIRESATRAITADDLPSVVHDVEVRVAAGEAPARAITQSVDARRPAKRRPALTPSVVTSCIDLTRVTKRLSAAMADDRFDPATVAITIGSDIHRSYAVLTKFLSVLEPYLHRHEAAS